MTEEPSSARQGGERLVAERYRLLSRLGEGGMGTVWRAHDELLRREVAVKEVRAPAGLPERDVERLYARLEREAWAAARVAHRNVVTVYDVATDEGRPWIVMELVRGLSLSDVLDAEGPMPPRRAAEIGAEVLAALRGAHEAGVLHRDVKPGNVLLANDGRVVLTDFGIATMEGTSALTLTGELIGSPEYLAPERALGRRPGPESDLWSLGVLLYTAVEGSSPFRQDTALSTMRAVVDEEPAPPRRAGPLAPVVEGLLRKDPQERTAPERAEEDLRLVAGGGLPAQRGGVRSGDGTTAGRTTVSGAPLPPAGRDPGGTDSAPTAPYRPVTGAFASGTPDSGGRPPEHAGPSGRSRRAALVLTAGLAVLALTVGGLTYALMDRDDGGAQGDGGSAGAAAGSGQGGKGGKDGGSGGSGSSGGQSDKGSTGGTDGKSEGGHSTSPAHQSVKVTLTAVRAHYAGTCPPPEDEAPAFTAVFTVGRTPVEVGYRWVTKSGTSSDGGWKTLSFGAGSSPTRQVHHVELGPWTEGTTHNELSVEVRSPVDARSGAVAFTVTCASEPPTTGGGGSYTPNASVRPRR